MQIFTISIGVLLLSFVNIFNASPVQTSDESDSSSIEGDEVVYVINIYAMRNTNTQAVGKMLTQNWSGKLPSTFESVGSFLFADDSLDEPITFDEFVALLEEVGMSVRTISQESHIAELLISEMDDTLQVSDIDEWVKYLQSEGIVIKMGIEGTTKVVEVSFDKTVKHPSEQSFSLAELAEYFEEQGFPVETFISNGEIHVIKVIFDIPKAHEDDPQVSKKQSSPDNEIITTSRTKEAKMHDIESKEDKFNEIDYNDQKKVDGYNDQKFIAPDYVTRADYVTKIRERRSTCPECKVGNTIKQIAAKYEIA